MVKRTGSGRDNALDVWMNGELVGTWSRTAAGVELFAYDATWLDSPNTRPLSLTLPFLPGNEAHRGEHVRSWFDNLLPDSALIRKRAAHRFGVSDDTRELLAEIGRDCVGAVQIVPHGEHPSESSVVRGDALTEGNVARLLRGVTANHVLGLGDTSGDEFRISVAGAQEKTALLYRGGRWYRPRGVTPSTHILKLPLGLVGNMKYDLRHSIDNEWLCLRLLGAMGFDVAHTTIATFSDDVGTERVLVVERFDRRWRADKRSILRLPQEDLCQATGTPRAKKYESDGGPGIARIVGILRGGVAAQSDVETFVSVQLAFWLLAAIDGHAKNFSIFLRRDGYAMTPIYDVMSAWPIIGRGSSSLAIQQAKLAMAVRCNSPHYKLQRIATRHWRCLAAQTGVSFASLETLVDRVPSAIEKVSGALPPGFSEAVWLAVTNGVQAQVERFKLGAQSLHQGD